MNERAKRLAPGFAQFGDADTLHIYFDGVVVVLGGNTDRHLTFREVLKKVFPGFEEARHGSVSVFLVEFPVAWTKPSDLHPWLICPTRYYHDHRTQDANTISEAVTLFESAFSQSVSKSRPSEG